ncbi:SpoIIE family protein phosphatase [Aurantibacillus circumpalustris]|uniref:SpoIIE family protein phosphatase n=1 Tax=Aurantibacillus circumpalustris TaxID=3036359 RepID=UPI00295B7BB7|nr:SpoIIE family protein phosphatase [Aurantibacillus circumpalustris]
MKNFFLIICLLCFSQNIFGQNRTMDSLNFLLNRTSSDSSRLNLYLKLCESCNIEENLKYATPALDIVNRLLSQANVPSEQQKYLRKKLEVYLYFKVYYNSKSNLTKLQEYNQICLQINYKLKDKEGVKGVIDDIVECYITQKNITKAMEILMQRLKKQEIVGDKKEEANTLKKIATVYARIRNTKKSLSYNLKALKILEEINDKESTPWILFNIGINYADLKDYNQALTYCLKGYNQLQNILEGRQKVKLLYHISYCYSKVGKYPEAREYKFLALEIGKNLQDTIIMGQVISGIGDIYLDENNLDKALEYHLEGLKLMVHIRAKNALVGTLLAIGEIYLKQNRIDLSLKYNLMAEDIASKRLDIYNERAISKRLYEAYAVKGDKYKTTEYHLKYYILNDSILKHENSQELLFREMNYENDRNESRLLEQQRKKDELSKAEKEKQKTIIYIIGFGLFFVIILSLFIFRSYKQKQKANKELSIKNATIASQKHLVEEKQKEITDSITYAKRLQEAILPPKEFVNKHVPDNFILYRPKDIVAGDFYWAECVGSKFFIAAADSTGHGVPGAMVSVVCSNALNRSVKEFKETETGKILDRTRDLVLETFEKSTSEVKDGMDISLLCIDRQNQKVYWSGANNPLWYIQNNELKEIKADKQPIGKTDHAKPFTTHELEYKENTTFYLFTDGLADQFGGPNGKKFKYKQFSDLLLQHSNLDPEQQTLLIDKVFSEWKGELEQVDDVCVIGIKI